MVKLVNIKDLKKYSKAYQKNKEKDLIKIENNKLDQYNFGVVKNYILDEKIYEVYLFAESGEEIASSLFCRTFPSNFKASIYYKLLTFLIRGNNKNRILKKISFFIR